MGKAQDLKEQETDVAMAARHLAKARRTVADEGTRTDKIAALGYSAEEAESHRLVSFSQRSPHDN
jgi:hypothetical protein